MEFNLIPLNDLVVRVLKKPNGRAWISRVSRIEPLVTVVRYFNLIFPRFSVEFLKTREDAREKKILESLSVGTYFKRSEYVRTQYGDAKVARWIFLPERALYNIGRVISFMSALTWPITPATLALVSVFTVFSWLLLSRRDA